MSRVSGSFWAVYGLAFIIAAAGFFVAWQFVGPPPPKTFRLAAGARGGGYYAFALRYAEFLEQRGVRVEVLETSGSIENLRLLRDPVSGVDVALVQGGVADGAGASGLVGLGSVCLEPLWVLLREGTTAAGLGDLKDKRVAIGLEGSGTHELSLRLLAANGIGRQALGLLPLGGSNAVEALLTGRVDAMMTVASIDAEIVKRLLSDRRVVPFSFARADAYARRFRFLKAVRLPRGAMDLAHDRPPCDLALVSPAATLVARDTFHPALADLMLQAAAAAHAAGDLLSDPGQFPSPLYLDFPLSRDAQRYFKHGPPVLQRFLPFWLATTVDRVKILVVPLLVLLMPIFKIVPPTLNWRIRGKITRWYRRLYSIDSRVEGADAAAVLALLDEIEGVEREVLRVMVPLGYADQLYNLRAHIVLVRNMILARKQRLEQGRSGPARG